MLCVYIKNCASYIGVEHMFRNHENAVNEQMHPNILNGKCDGYMCGFGGAEKRKR